MARIVAIAPQAGIAEHAAVAHLASAVAALRQDVERAAVALRGRTIWMVNSTESGGGVAEMLPAMITLLRDLGVAVEWAVMESAEPHFFEITKRIHNLIHDSGNPRIEPAEIALYEAVNQQNARALLERIQPGDIVVLHDPQPLGMAPVLRRCTGVQIVWRCHIGLDERTARTEAAWALLRRYTDACDRVVFSAQEYVPRFLAERAVLIQPAVDPLSPKNCEMSLHAIVCVLARSGLSTIGPTVSPPFTHPAGRIGPEGDVVDPATTGEFGLLSRPIVTQVSRWDRLKGFLPLLHAFARLKQKPGGDGEHRRRLELVRLVLAGPALGAVADDPESADVLHELVRAYTALPRALQDEIAIVLLPMESREDNALIVNALQRASTIVAQNSLREGFGLTIAEAMWKHIPVLSSARACGPRNQIVDGEHGRLVADPENVDEVANTLDAMLRAPEERARWGRNAQRRAHDEFMIFTQLRRWVDLCHDLARSQPVRRQA